MLKTSALWRPSTFHEQRPKWCAANPELTGDLLALDDKALSHLSGDSALSAAWLKKALPVLETLPSLVEILPSPHVPAPTVRRHGVSVRKAAQIDAFVAAVVQPQAPLVEWCAGKGHLSRRFLESRGGGALAIERDAGLCAAGEAISHKNGDSLRFQCADVMAAETAETLVDAHAVALHACGDLHRRLLEAAIEAGARAIDVAPCCYQLTAAEIYRPMSAASALNLNRNGLKLAVTETITASPRKRILSEQASAWKLAFTALRGKSEPLRSVPGRWQSDGFPSFLAHLAEREGLSIPAGVDFAACEAAGWKRHRESRRLQLVRLSFRRVLEIWLLCDMAAWLEQNGWAVSLQEFCARPVTPRNLLLSARKC